MGAHPDQHGFMLEAGSIWSNQIAKFATVNTHICTLIRQQFDPLILLLFEKMTVTMPPEPIIIMDVDESVSIMEEITYKKKYGQRLTQLKKSRKI
jgi:hypothetical protein